MHGSEAALTESWGFAVSQSTGPTGECHFLRTSHAIMSEINVAPFFLICCALLILLIRKKNLETASLCCVKLKFLDDDSVLEDRAK